jgi:serine protease Do
VNLTFIRNGKQQEASVTIADRAKLFASRLGEDQGDNEDSSPKQSKFGVTVKKLTPEMAERLDVPAGKGVIVQEVKPDSFAEDVGLARGDVILEVNKQPVNNEDDLAKIETAMKSGQDVVFLVRERGTTGQQGAGFLAGTLP